MFAVAKMLEVCCVYNDADGVCVSSENFSRKKSSKKNFKKN